MDRYSLPHGAKGTEAEDFAVAFGSDKIVFVPKSQGGKHYPLHAGPKSGVIELHETVPGTDGGEQHRTLFAMHSDDLVPLTSEVAPMLPELFRLFGAPQCKVFRAEQLRRRGMWTGNGTSIEFGPNNRVV